MIGKIKMATMVGAAVSAGVVGTTVPVSYNSTTGTTTVKSKLTVTDPNSDTGNQFLVTDKNGAPMFWVNIAGAQSGGEPVCVEGLQLQPLACLGGPLGSYGGQSVVTLYNGNGQSVSLTYQDIVDLHNAGM